MADLSEQLKALACLCDSRAADEDVNGEVAAGDAWMTAAREIRALAAQPEPIALREKLRSCEEALATAERRIAELEAAQPAPADREIEQLIRERDDREGVIDKILDIALGSDRREWSSLYGYSEAIEEVEERMAAPAGEVAMPRPTDGGAVVEGFARGYLSANAAMMLVFRKARRVVAHLDDGSCDTSKMPEGMGNDLRELRAALEFLRSRRLSGAKEGG